MARPSSCPTCGAPLAPDASTSGLCPACLLTNALEDDNLDAPRDSVGLLPGARLGPFRIDGLLGKGGMASVYDAYEEPLDRVVALKVLPPEFLHNETFAKRFKQEARIVARLEHAHIVPIYASGIDAGIPWISMRLLRGGSLASVLAGDRLDIDQMMKILRGVAEALDYAHARGVIHRDVKPSNILLDQAGHVCVSDFGLAQLMEGHEGLTLTGTVAGTPQYMAPEQGLGQPIDHRCDIYSLGVVAYEMLTGTTPFRGESPVVVLMKHVRDPLPVPPRTVVSDVLFRALQKALAKNPGDRWPTASAFVVAMETSVATSRRAQTTWTTPTTRKWVWSVMRQPRVVKAASTIALAAAGVALLWPSTTSPPAVAPAAVQTVPVQDTSTPEPAAQSPIARPEPARDADTTSQRPATAAAPKPGLRPDQNIAPKGAKPTIAAETRPPEPPDDANDGQLKPVDSPSTKPEAPIGVEVEKRPVDTPPTAVATPVTPTAPSDVITQPIRIRTVNPTYPPLARAASMEGNVLLQATVGPDGRVNEVEVLRSDNRVFDDAARRAVLEYQYKPGQRNGKPATFKVQITVSFRLQ